MKVFYILFNLIVIVSCNFCAYIWNGCLSEKFIPHVCATALSLFNEHTNVRVILPIRTDIPKNEIFQYVFQLNRVCPFISNQTLSIFVAEEDLDCSDMPPTTSKMKYWKGLQRSLAINKCDAMVFT